MNHKGNLAPVRSLWPAIRRFRWTSPSVVLLVSLLAATVVQAQTPDPDSSPPADWPGWRGADRSACVARLPARLAARPKVVWQRRLAGEGHSGVAVSRGRLLLADKDPQGQMDIFRCLDTETGRQIWKLQYDAPGKMDYGNSSRATPWIEGDKAYLLGAMGHLHCVRMDDGQIVWRRNLVSDFQAELPTWGYCSSPLVVDGRLIVNPGSRSASLVALDAGTGTTLWQTAGGPAAYASPIVGRFGGVRQVVGYDADGLGGWDPADGRRLWRLKPPHKGDFNVPTPIDAGGKLLVSTENNGTRLYDFDPEGRIRPEPLAVNEDLSPDTSTPVLCSANPSGREIPGEDQRPAGAASPDPSGSSNRLAALPPGRVVGCDTDLFCLDVNQGLKAVWQVRDATFEDYCSLIASPDRVLVIGSSGQALLVRTEGPAYELLGRCQLLDDGANVTSHPALVGNRLYLRTDARIACLVLDEEGP